jgi:hypothetical protein
MRTRCTAALAALLLAACQHGPRADRLVDVPPQLKPPAGETLAMVVKATGVQIYECRAGNDDAYRWVFVAPEAQLFDERGATLGRHYAGPHWEAPDGSKVAGSLRERAEAPRPGAIAWLLLDARSVGASGAFSRVTSIQRVNTVGGSAPPTACARGNGGDTARVPYSADYYLFTAAR